MTSLIASLIATENFIYDTIDDVTHDITDDVTDDGTHNITNGATNNVVYPMTNVTDDINEVPLRGQY